MKPRIGLFAAAILACIGIAACIGALGTVVQKARSIPGSSSATESGVKQAGEHMAHGSASPTPSPSAAAGQSPAATSSPGARDY